METVHWSTIGCMALLKPIIQIRFFISVKLAARLRLGGSAWVVFVNTALSHAYSNGMELQALLGNVDSVFDR